jgi:hypothetical protein
MKQILVSLALLVVAVAWIWPGNVVKRPPGVLAPDEPDQNLVTNGRTWQVKAYTVTPLADYRIRARVLMTERYWLGRESDLSPIDITVGWRRMSDQAILDQISFIREHRAYRYQPKTGGWPIPIAEAISHSANMHMIPANDGINDALQSIREGDIVEFNGYLVEVTAADGWRWRSSLSRTDDGPHACELMWVTRVSLP